MKTKTYFVANDGTEHDRQELALKHEKFIADIAQAMNPLGEKYEEKECRFVNGEGYIQHDPADVLKAKTALIEICKTTVPDEFWNKYTPAEIHPMSYAGRLLDDCNRFLYRAWYRFMCIDVQGKEWGQPYYALHPEAGTHKRINPTEAK